MTRPSTPVEDAAALWVRRCIGCDDYDLTTAVGSAALMDRAPWRCPRCGAPCWVAACLAFPREPTRCPHHRTGADEGRR